ncbi:hypothetical protein HZY62_15500 [Maribacter polysiphoniae]|uniref:HNH domain-containing protein n=1 Tax=Maribacter polysiphoniae TaxID=429344 RepID=A0A316DVC6_9FLAO|nr:HNH endonuclease [Maribacter polysiphoniae]MBD1262007.1 hypothetical protein [Maribacter polysiphoniae]PWK21696.1 hypothetical protein LX92_03475 [Maribacter polysiphoniae]
MSKDIDVDILLLLLLLGVGIIPWLIKRWRFNLKKKSRQNYYRKTYLKSAAWKRKRYVVLKRDNWKCVYCGKRDTQVHHKRYSKKNIGKEPIKWLVSICKSCHDELH